MLEAVAIFASVGIAAAYGYLGVTFSTAVLAVLPAHAPLGWAPPWPLHDVPARRVVWVLRRALNLGSLIFFATCAMTHVDEAIHLAARDAVGQDLATWPHAVNCLVQFVGAWAFIAGLRSALSLIAYALSRVGAP